jgi:uncharacterized repeat protein (TIGR01451 family)
MVRGRRRFVSLAVTLAAVLAAAVYGGPAAAGDPNPPVNTFTYTSNMEPLGWEPRPNPTSSIINSDLAFWGNRAYEGTYDGFQIIDITNPEDPQQVLDYNQCSPGTSSSNQGDVIVWNNILVRSWNSPTTGALTCDGDTVVVGFEGLHVFDISNELNPDLVAQINLPCGSHTATGVPDLANNRLLVYNSGSSSTCPSIEIVEVPFANPAGAALNRVELNGRNTQSCHDTSVILGSALRAACAGGTGFSVWSLDPADGGSLLDPMLMYTKTVTGVSIGHSHTFSWDGSILIFGHEPGGGVAPNCQSTSPQVNKTLFFYDAETGNQVGQWVLPRPQSAQENCTIHNFNVVPSNQYRILVSGNYQSGIAVVDFTDPSNPVEIAYADPAPLVPEFDGGDWSSYWYNGNIYESDIGGRDVNGVIRGGMFTWRLNDRAVAHAQTLGHLNPQTQEFTIPFLGQRADLSLVKAGPSGRQPTGRNMTYTLSVTNNGPDAAANVVVTDTLPASVTFVSATPSQGSCGQAAGVVTCNLGTLGNGATATISIVVRPTQAGIITNTAVVSTSTPDPDAANDTSSVNTSICRITSRRSSIPCG